MPALFKEKPMPRALTVALCLAAVPALGFEGVIETKMTMNRGKMDGAPEGVPTSFSGTGTITVKGLNSRMEQQMNVPGMGTGGKTVVIYRADEKTTYILNTASKTYSKHAREPNEDESDSSKWTVKKLGKDTVAGRSVEHVQVQRAGGGDTLEADALPPDLHQPRDLHEVTVEIPADGIDLEAMLDQIEHRYLQMALARTGGVQTRAAELLRVSFRQFRYKLQKHGQRNTSSA